MKNKKLALSIIEGALLEMYDDVFGQAAKNTNRALKDWNIGDLLSRSNVDVQHTDFSKFQLKSTTSRDKELKIPGFVNVFIVSLRTLKYEKFAIKSQFLPGLEPPDSANDADKPTTPTYRFYFSEPELYIYAVYVNGEENFNLSRFVETRVPDDLIRYNKAPYTKREDGKLYRDYDGYEEDRKEDLASRIDKGILVTYTDKSKILFGQFSTGRGRTHWGLVPQTSWSNLLSASEWVYKLPAGKVATTVDLRKTRALSKEGALALTRRSQDDRDNWYYKLDASGYPSRRDELKKKALEIRAKSPSLSASIDETIAKLETIIRDLLSKDLTSGIPIATMSGTFKKLADVSALIAEALRSLEDFKKHPADYNEDHVKRSLQKLKNILANYSVPKKESLDKKNKDLALSLIEKE